MELGENADIVEENIEDMDMTIIDAIIAILQGNYAIAISQQSLLTILGNY
jgi:hypothetical protein